MISYLQIFSVSVVDSSQYNTHKHIETNNEIDEEEDCEPFTVVVGWHPEKKTILGNQVALIHPFVLTHFRISFTILPYSDSYEQSP